MSKVAVLAKITALPGKRAELVNEFQFALDNVKNEPGTLTYILHEDSANEDVLYFYEIYTDQSALEAHGSADWFKELGPKLRPFTASRPEITLLKPVGGKGL